MGFSPWRASSAKAAEHDGKKMFRKKQNRSSRLLLSKTSMKSWL
jgi:hypothetical protein